MDHLLEERKKTHGEYKHNSQFLVETITRMPHFNNMDDISISTLINTAQKVSRMVAGDTLYKDHIIDINGYITLFFNSKNKKEKYTPPDNFYNYTFFTHTENYKVKTSKIPCSKITKKKRFLYINFFRNLYYLSDHKEIKLYFSILKEIVKDTENY